MESKFEFIILSHPSQGSSSNLQRRAYSHAARVTHARVKSARKASDVELNVPHMKKAVTSETTGPKSKLLAEIRGEDHPMALSDPVDQLTSSRRDPFRCFARPLSELEHYLFDHCE